MFATHSEEHSFTCSSGPYLLTILLNVSCLVLQGPYLPTILKSVFISNSCSPCRVCIYYLSTILKNVPSLGLQNKTKNVLEWLINSKHGPWRTNILTFLRTLLRTVGKYGPWKTRLSTFLRMVGKK